MRVLSIVTLVTPDGAYGGPTRVAMNQAAALEARGHQVTLAAAARGFDRMPTTIEGVAARLFPARTAIPGTGFAGLTSPGLLQWLRTAIADFDVVHVHATRDLITLPAAWLARRAQVPYLMQPHGMIDPSANPLAVPLDAALTRPLLRGAARVLHLTTLERDQLRAVAGDLAFAALSNGVPPAEAAPASPTPPEVLFLARLAARKRPTTFVEAAREVAPRFPQTQFAVVGPDEGEAAQVSRQIAEASAEGVAIAWEGPIAPEHTLERMAKAAVYVLPAVDEPYGMTVVEALSIGRPVIVTDSCGLAEFVTTHRAGLVVDSSVEGLAAAIGTLLADPAEAAACGQRGRDAVRTEFGMDAIAARLEEYYSAAVSDAPRTDS